MSPTPEGSVAVYPPGALIWVPDQEEVWKAAEVLHCEPPSKLVVRVEEDSQEVTLGPNKPTYLRNVDVFSTDGLVVLDDLTQLTHLHEAAVLHSLHVRFDIDRIYTFTGPILIAVNPFKTISGMYDFETLKTFLDFKTPQVNQKRCPHVFSTGSAAYRGLCTSKASQTILISGESGAGKTESTKFVMKLLALAGSKDWNNRSLIENQVLQSNPLLETMGNAKTLRNDNSSRFGKFIEMQFMLEPQPDVEIPVGRLAGARIHTYLLETVRVCHQAEGERNYHSFYQLCAAAAQTDADGKYKYPQKIKSAEAKECEFDLSLYASHENFRYLTRSTCFRLARVDDIEEFEYTTLAMQTVGISYEDQVSIWNIIGAVLYLGNLDFEPPHGESESSALKASCKNSFDLAAYFLGVEPDLLRQSLTIRTIKARNERFKKPLRVHEAEDARDALARALYGTLFLKIVKQTNASIGYREDVKLFCGVLDIFGFECFDFNSFEQLCINFTNERLQQFFNTFIFKCEEEIYKKEGIPWDPLDFPDNADCVDILQAKPFGVFSMLDEECFVPQGNDQNFCNKLKDKHKAHRRFGIIKTKRNWFIVNHFAGPVAYCVDGFLDKNKDQLSDDAISCIEGSKKSFVQSLFRDFLRKAEDGKSKTKKSLTTVSSEFRQQLSYLMDAVRVTEPHFIRCIKPNPQNKPDLFHRRSVTEQLRYAGVLQAVQVSRAGYPIRLPHVDTFLDYKALCDKSAVKELWRNSNPKDRALKMLQHLDEKLKIPKPKFAANSWAVGQTLVFLKHEAYEVLSSSRAELRLRAAVRIQADYKAFKSRAYYQTLRACTIIIQAGIRGRLARKDAQSRRETKAAIIIQKYARGALARLKFRRAKKSVFLISWAWRVLQTRRQLKELRKERAATTIQAAMRCYKQRKYYVELRRGTIKAQLRWRQILAKRQLKRLRAEQKEAGALLKQKQKLQEETQSLKQRLKELEAHALQVSAEKERLAKELKESNMKVEELSSKNAALEESVRAQVESLKQSATVLRKMSSLSVPAAPAPTDSPRQVEVFSKDAAKARASISPVAEETEAEASAADLSAAIEEARAMDVRVRAEQEETIKQLRKELQDVTDQLHKEVQSKEEMSTWYQTLLKAESMKIPTQFRDRVSKGASLNANHAVPASPLMDRTTTTMLSRSAAPVTTPVTKTVDILVLGSRSSGKDALLEELRACFPVAGQAVTNQKISDDEMFTNIKLEINGSVYTLLCCSEVLSAKEVRSMSAISHYILILYSLYDMASYRKATQFLKMTAQHPSRIMFGCQKTDGSPAEPAIDLTALKDMAARQNCGSIEGYSLKDIVESMTIELTDIDRQHKVQMQQAPTTGAAGSRYGRMGLFASGTTARAGGTRLWESHTRPSGASGFSVLVKQFHGLFNGDKSTKSAAPLLSPLRAAYFGHAVPADLVMEGGQESQIGQAARINIGKSPITCMSFGRETSSLEYYLLAIGTKEGSAYVLRVYKTEVEKRLSLEENNAIRDFAPIDGNFDGLQTASTTDPEDTLMGTDRSAHGGDVPMVGEIVGAPGSQQYAVHAVLKGHKRAVTSIYFTRDEQELVTASIDQCVMYWHIDTGTLKKVFADSSACLHVTPLPPNPSLFLVANTARVLRVVNSNTGEVAQRLRMDSEVRAMTFDHTGFNCISGTRCGTLNVLEIDSATFKLSFKLKVKVAKAPITCVTFCQSERLQPFVCINTCDNTLTILQCVYGQPSGTLKNLIVRSRLRIAHNMLPLRSVFSPYGGGWVFSASEDCNVHAVALDANRTAGANQHVSFLKGHTDAVVAVSVSAQSTLLASGSCSGELILWRSVDGGFAHMADALTPRSQHP